MRLTDIASRLGVSENSLKAWNPELRNDITPPRPRYELRLPEEKIEKFASIESQIPNIRVQNIKIHRVRRGDTLYRIAQQYGVTRNMLFAVNTELKERQILRIGKEIAIPIPSVQVIR